jgi:hypothetical protein
MNALVHGIEGFIGSLFDRRPCFVNAGVDILEGLVRTVFSGLDGV